MPRVGILSDTHGSLPQAALDAFSGCDYLIHAGDICAHQVLWELEAVATTIAVLGNCDVYDYGPSVDPTCAATIGGVRVFVSHFPEEAERAAASGEYGLAVHGHTHVPRDEMRGGCRIVNPGSTTHPRGGSSRSVAIVELEDGMVGPVRFVEL